MNAKRLSIILLVSLISLLAQPASADSARTLVRQGNQLYSQGQYNQAIKEYNQALIEKPQAAEPKFDKANSYYRLDDIAQAIETFKQVSTESRDMKLVAKAKYNLGNCYFQQGFRQKDSNLEKAVEDLKTSIGYWRAVLDIEPENKKAAQNIEVARLIIKDIIDQQNKRKQQDANQPQQQQKQNQQQDANQQQQQQASQQDANQPQQQKQQGAGQEPNKPQEPNQQQEKAQPQQQEKQEQKAEAVDATAQEILDKEQRQRQERQMLQRGGYQKVDKDW